MPPGAGGGKSDAGEQIGPRGEADQALLDLLQALAGDAVALLDGADVGDRGFDLVHFRSMGVNYAALNRRRTMALKVSKADVWAVTSTIGRAAPAEKLEALSKAGANLEMVLARRTEARPGRDVRDPDQGREGGEGGAGRPAWASRESIHSVRVEGGDKPGLGAKIARTLGDAGRQLPRLVGDRHGQEVRELHRLRQRRRSGAGHRGAEEGKL